jgi:hypothetical protein
MARLTSSVVQLQLLIAWRLTLSCSFSGAIDASIFRGSRACGQIISGLREEKLRTARSAWKDYRWLKEAVDAAMSGGS